MHVLKIKKLIKAKKKKTNLNSTLNFYNLFKIYIF